MLQIQSIVQRFGSLTALDGVTLSIREGECFGLLGPNGAGKSTLMSLIAGLREPTAGHIELGGKPVSVSNFESRRLLGFAPQHLALYTRLSAEQNLTIFGSLFGLRGKELKQRVAELLEAVQLADRRKDIVKEFSGGMQRRLNIAAALLHNPRVLLCDEPTVGVDPQSRNAIFDFLEERIRGGLTVIYSTHYMEEATRLCDRIGIIDHGKVLATGTLEELLTQLLFEDEICFPAEPGTAVLAEALKANGDLQQEEGTYRFRPSSGFPLSRFYAETESKALSPRLFRHERPSLEAVFLHLTGRNLRD